MSITFSQKNPRTWFTKPPYIQSQLHFPLIRHKGRKEISKKPQELYGMSFEFRSNDNEKHSAVQYLLNL